MSAELIVKTPFNSLLIDGDRIAADFSARAESQVRSQKTHNVHAMEEKTVMELGLQITEWQQRFEAHTVQIALSDTAHYRRRLFPDYQAYSSIATRDSHLYQALLLYLKRNYSSLRYPGLESIDVLGVWATSPYTLNEPRLMITSNPNLDMIPGYGWDPRNEDSDPVQNSRFLADLMFFRQALTGRAADNFEGCPGIDTDKIETLLQPFREAVTDYREDYFSWLEGLWRMVVREYTKAGKNEEDALFCARLARICRYGDYDFEKKTPRLWRIPRSDTGTASGLV